jgi:hypothetical protein
MKEQVIQIQPIYPEIKCKECGCISAPDRTKWGCEPDICDECLKKGWLPMDCEEANRILGLKENQKLNSKIYRLSPFYKVNNIILP